MKTNFLKSSLVLALLAITAVSCKKNVETAIPEDTTLKVEETALHNFDCLMKVDPSDGPTTEANGPSNKRWPNGSIVKVRFNGGSTFVRNKIIKYAKSWEAYANITFSFVADNASADIKVAINDNDRAWSTIGTDARGKSTSMNFGWFDNNTSDTEFRRTTVHEFGHALALDHEQAHPDANIPWNTQAVYNYYMGAPNYWNKQEIEYNVLQVNSRSGLNYTPYDTKSIMHYPVQARFTTNNVTIAPNNTTISQGDIAYIKQYYPGR